MSFPKLAVTLILTILIFAISILVIASPSVNSAMYVEYKVNSLSLSSYPGKVIGEKQGKQNNTLATKSNENKTSLALFSANQSQGKLIVINKVVNEGGGNKKASDFTINVHGNDPLPSSFSGSSSGIPVMLHMGMYSVTEKGPLGYNSTLSDDCSGGMMSAETKKCIITNTYSKGVFGVK
jgi:Prealbumin-like fold domain